MELKQLRYFVAVAEALHFSKAAKKVYVSQSALSQQIKLLENEIGTDLFVRSKRIKERRVELTEAGTVFLIEAKKILQMSAKALETARRIGLHKKEIRFGIFRTFLKERLEMVELFAANFPDVDLKIVELDLHWDVQEALSVEQIDVGFTFTPVTKKDLAFKAYRKTSLAIVMPNTHRLASSAAVYLSDLKEEKWIEIGGQVNPVLDQIEAACELAGFSREKSIVQLVNNLELMFSLVGLGIGIAFVPGFIVLNPSTNLVMKSILNPDGSPFTDIEVSVGLAYKEKTTNPLILAYAGLVREVQ